MTQPVPKDIQPSELFARLTALPRPHKMVDLPRKDAEGNPVGRVAMVSLTQEEAIAASAEAERMARKILKDGIPKQDDAQTGYLDTYNNIAACEILYRACKDADDATLKRGAFRTPHEIRSGLTNDEIGVMYHHYLTVKSEIGPIVATMTDDEFEAWVKVLAEGASAVPLDCLSWGALTTLVLTMASRLHSLQTLNSSAGSPSEQERAEQADSQE